MNAIFSFLLGLIWNLCKLAFAMWVFFWIVDMLFGWPNLRKLWNRHGFTTRKTTPKRRVRMIRGPDGRFRVKAPPTWEDPYTQEEIDTAMKEVERSLRQK